MTTTVSFGGRRISASWMTPGHLRDEATGRAAGVDDLVSEPDSSGPLE